MSIFVIALLSAVPREVPILSNFNSDIIVSMYKIHVLRAFDTAVPKPPHVSVSSQTELIKDAMPVANPFTELWIFCQSKLSTRPPTESVMAFPRLSQLKVHANPSKATNAELMPSANVFPMAVNNPGVPMNPLRNVAMLFAVFSRVPLIPSQEIPSKASLSFAPNIAPISVKSALAHASLIISAMFL